MMDPVRAWPAFRKLVRSRLAAGATSYGSSTSRPLPLTLGEISEELSDVAGWACVAFARIEALKARAEILEGAHGPTQDAAPVETLEPFRLDATTAELLLRISRTLRIEPADAVRFAVHLMGERYGLGPRGGR